MSPKKIILAVTGSIAAYKSAFLTRLLIKEGFEVQVIMTGSAKDFVSPLTFSTLSKRPVHVDVSNESSWNNHVEMGLWADAMIIAPATANTIAKMANGICDNMVTATYLSAKCQVYIAPAMDLDMWKHPATIANLEKLKSYGHHIIPVGNGELASGLVGDGRMAEPEDIVNFISGNSANLPLAGKKALVTAGPTYEKIDPVRFIGNHSSGKMGVAIAMELAKQGATVDLVLGPSKIAVDYPGVHVTRVEAAAEMYEAADKYFKKCDVAVLAAAVADYKPKEQATQKIKKKDESLSITLEKTVDIAASLGKIKKKGQTIIGFALETNDEEANAMEKMKRKNFDMIVLNSLQDKGAGFNHDTNKVTIFTSKGQKLDFELKSKQEVAADVVTCYIELLRSK
ncbi:MAG: bifunctional phosphopantothenoylcysteine decarboxylase/phosphopantothenate--cysteine ligase CoaBC [Saprospiraceae bacterium]|nr:bifunctional phosphopantothenoylcysteine decarboxylase/phosphopantothenate--cysteine ligase CoaBC [Saprospiraceae bacterium]